MTFKHHEISVPFMVDGEPSDAFKARVNGSYRAMDEALRTNMYGSYPGAPAVRERQTVRAWVSKWHWRVRNAWDVLRGRADIC